MIKFKEVGKLKWFFMNYKKRLLYNLPIIKNNKQRLWIGNYALDFTGEKVITEDEEIVGQILYYKK